MPWDRGFNILVGPQAPEGYQQAPPGFLFVDQANGDLYIKKSSTGTDGWSPVGGAVTQVVDDVTLNTGHSLVDAKGTDPIEVELPPAAASVGQIYTVRCSGTGDVTITPDGDDTIGGAASLVLTAVGDFATFYQPIPEGVDWVILDSVVTGGG